MNKIGTTLNNQGEITPVFECNAHGTRSKTELCKECVKQEVWDYDCSEGFY